MGERVDQETVAGLGRLVELGLTPERVAVLTLQLQDLLAFLAPLDDLDLLDVEPESVFSAEWR